MDEQNNINENLYKLKNQITHAGLFFCYSGPISQGIIEEIGDTIKSRIILESRNTTIAFKIYSIFIEQTQNIIKYSSDPLIGETMIDTRLKDSIIILGKKHEKYFIGFGNLIENSKRDQLQAKLDYIKNMDKTALKIFYKEQMHKEIAPDCSSMGIGLIEIAKNASEPLEYCIHKVNQEYSFFSLYASVFIRS